MSSLSRQSSLALALLLLSSLLALADAQSVYIKMEPTGTSTCNYNCYDLPCPAATPCSCFSGTITLTTPLASLSCALYFVNDVEVTSLLIQPSFNNLTVGFTNGRWKSGSLSFNGASSAVTVRNMAFPDGASLSAAVSSLTLSSVSMGTSTMTLTTPTVVLSNFSTSGQITVSSSDVVLNMTNAVVSTPGTLIVSGFLRNTFNFKGVSGSALKWIDSSYAPSSISVVGSDMSLATSSSTNGAFFSTLPTNSLSISNSTFRNNNNGLSATLFQTTNTMGSFSLANATLLPGTNSRISFGPSFPLTGQLSIKDSFFGSEFGSISWTSTASLLVRNSNFGQLSNAIDTGLVAPFNIYNLSSAVSLCTEAVELGAFSLLFSIDVATDSSSPTAIALFCNSSMDSLRVTSSFSITGAYSLAVSSVVSIGSQYWLTVSNGASLVIPTTFTLTSVYLNLSDPSSTLYYAPGGPGSAFSPATLNGSMTINSNAAIKLAPGLTNFRLMLAAPSASSTLPRAGDVYTIFKSVSVTYGSAFVTASPWRAQVTSNSVSGDLAFSFVNQTCDGTCVHPSPLGCISTSVCSCDDYWTGERCEISTVPLAPSPPANAPTTLPSNTSTTLAPGSHTTYGGDLIINGDLVISPNATVIINGTLTVNGRLRISADLEEVRIGSKRRRDGWSFFESTQALPFCVVSSQVSIRASRLVFSASSVINFTFDLSEVSTNGSCVEPPLADPLWESLHPVLYSTSYTTIDSLSSWHVSATGATVSTSGLRVLQFTLPLVNSSNISASSGVVSSSRESLKLDTKLACPSISSTPGAVNFIVSSSCPSPPADKNNTWIYIMVGCIAGAVAFVGILMLILTQPCCDSESEDYEMGESASTRDIPYGKPTSGKDSDSEYDEEGIEYPPTTPGLHYNDNFEHSPRVPVASSSPPGAGASSSSSASSATPSSSGAAPSSPSVDSSESGFDESSSEERE